MRKIMVAAFSATMLSLAPITVHAAAPAQDVVEDEDDDDKTGLWGLVGLLGLAGLAGLKRRDVEVRRSTYADRTTPPPTPPPPSSPPGPNR